MTAQSKSRQPVRPTASFQSGERGIRTLGTGFPAHRISNPAHSATLASLRLSYGNILLKL